LNLTGGWHWHWRAWRSQKRWVPAAAQIEDWLLAQAMPRQQLVLIGASAGWMLPTAWLTQFEEVHAWDIDPLAAPLFRWRHGPGFNRAGTIAFHRPIARYCGSAIGKFATPAQARYMGQSS
jgi:hypothetical protein